MRPCCTSFAAAVLLVGAVATLGSIGYHLVKDLGDGVEHAVAEALDGLLLVFILLELLAAVRQIMDEHRLVAEPFLIVGMLASIKEIVVLALVAQEELGKPGQEFENAMTEIGVLAASSSSWPSPCTWCGARSGSRRRSRTTPGRPRTRPSGAEVARQQATDSVSGSGWDERLGMRWRRRSNDRHRPLHRRPARDTDGDAQGR